MGIFIDMGVTYCCRVGDRMGYCDCHELYSETVQSRSQKIIGFLQKISHLSHYNYTRINHNPYPLNDHKLDISICLRIIQNPRFRLIYSQQYPTHPFSYIVHLLCHLSDSIDGCLL